MANIVNINAKVNDKGKLVLFIDPKQNGELSGTGKSFVIASARWYDLSDLPGCEGLAINCQVIRKLAKKKVKKVEPDDDDDTDEGPVETKTKNKGKKPKLNRDKDGKVKPIATSTRVADKLRVKRSK
jgi:hypothetical protein